MDNILKVRIMGGNCVDIEVLDIVELNAESKKYVVYTLANSDTNDVYMSILNETKNGYSLDTIEDENELRDVENYLIRINGENFV